MFRSIPFHAYIREGTGYAAAAEIGKAEDSPMIIDMKEAESGRARMICLVS